MVDILGNIKNNLGTIGAGVGGVVAGGALGYLAGSAASSSRKSSGIKRRKRKTSSNGRKRRTPRTAGKGKDTSRKRIRYTKNGQPYVIMASGKAKFIKKKGARRSHKTKGGRY
jgi:hypothetical protein